MVAIGQIRINMASSMKTMTVLCITWNGAFWFQMY